MSLRRFQKQFITNALNPGIDVAALSIPRGNGKSWLAAYLLTRCLTPTDHLFVQGAEYLLCAASIEQARLCYRFVRADLEPTGEYRFIDSVTRLAIVHKATNTRLRVLSSNGKTAMGIVNCPLLVADEPGSWEVTGGQLMNDAIETAIGKPNSDLKVVYIGTLAPGTGGWWHDLIESGTRGSTYVQALQGDPEKWDQWSEIKRVNPLTAISPSFRRRLIQERDDARGDTRLKARFLSYRLNVPSTDESKMLLEVADWELMTARTVPERRGSPIVGIDLGGGRAWSSAVAVWENGRVEALALAPGDSRHSIAGKEGPSTGGTLPATCHGRDADRCRRAPSPAAGVVVGVDPWGLGNTCIGDLRQVPAAGPAGRYRNRGDNRAKDHQMVRCCSRY